MNVEKIIWILFFREKLQNEIVARIDINKHEFHYILAAYVFQDVNKYFSYKDLSKVIQENYTYKLGFYDLNYSKIPVKLCEKGYFNFFAIKQGHQCLKPVKYYTLNFKKVNELFSLVYEILPSLGEGLKNAFLNNTYNNYVPGRKKMFQFLNTIEFE